MPGPDRFDGELGKGLQPGQDGESETLGDEKLRGLRGPGDHERSDQDGGRGPQRGGGRSLAQRLCKQEEKKRVCARKGQQAHGTTNVCPAFAWRRRSAPTRPSWSAVRWRASRNFSRAARAKSSWSRAGTCGNSTEKESNKR